MPTNNLLYWLSFTPAVAFLGYLVWRYISVLRAKPRLVPSDVIFQEWFASGCSQKNIITKIGGGRNCVRLVVTPNFLWVTTWFPFSLIAPLYDMEHVVPLSAITIVKKDKYWGMPTLLITFTTDGGGSRTLRLMPKKPEAFAQSLAQKAA
jgi:hypothetical protein